MKHNCEYCGYSTDDNAKWERHTTSKTHLMKEGKKRKPVVADSEPDDIPKDTVAYDARNHPGAATLSQIVQSFANEEVPNIDDNDNPKRPYNGEVAEYIIDLYKEGKLIKYLADEIIAQYRKKNPHMLVNPYPDSDSDSD